MFEHLQCFILPSAFVALPLSSGASPHVAPRAARAAAESSRNALPRLGKKCLPGLQWVRKFFNDYRVIVGGYSMLFLLETQPVGLMSLQEFLLCSNFPFEVE